MRMSPPAAVQLQDVEPAESALRRTASSQVNLLPPRHGTFNLATTGGRRRVYAIIVAGLFLLAWLLQGAKSHKSHEALDFVVSDAEGYWVYLPSLVLDGNLDFRRQLYWHSGVHPIDSSQFHVTPMGFGNHWPTGVAMTLAPGFLAAHALSIAVYHLSASPLFAPNGYSLAYQFFGVAMVMLLGWCTLAAADDVLARRYKLPGRTITAGVVVYALGSSWAYYIFREPFMSHAIGAAWVMLTILLADKITAAADERRIVWWHWPAIVFTFSMAIICRPTNIVTLILVAWALIATVRAGLFGKTLRAVPLMILAAFPFILQLITWHILAPRNAATGGIAIGYSRREVFDWFASRAVEHPLLQQTRPAFLVPGSAACRVGLRPPTGAAGRIARRILCLASACLRRPLVPQQRVGLLVVWQGLWRSRLRRSERHLHHRHGIRI